MLVIDVIYRHHDQAASLFWKLAQKVIPYTEDSMYFRNMVERHLSWKLTECFICRGLAFMVYRKHALMNPKSLVSETQRFLGLAGKTDEPIVELQDQWRILSQKIKQRAIEENSDVKPCCVYLHVYVPHKHSSMNIHKNIYILAYRNYIVTICCLSLLSCLVLVLLSSHSSYSPKKSHRGLHQS